MFVYQEYNTNSSIADICLMINPFSTNIVKTIVCSRFYCTITILHCQQLQNYDKNTIGYRISISFCKISIIQIMADNHIDYLPFKIIYVKKYSLKLNHCRQFWTHISPRKATNFTQNIIFSIKNHFKQYLFLYIVIFVYKKIAFTFQT